MDELVVNFRLAVGDISSPSLLEIGGSLKCFAKNGPWLGLGGTESFTDHANIPLASPTTESTTVSSLLHASYRSHPK